MKTYTNFYETAKEANIRLQDTVILYDDEPYYVLCVDDTKDDGIFRIYMEPTGHDSGYSVKDRMNVPCHYPDPTMRGKLMDEFMVKNPNEKIVRKMMNSPSFNKFRPFPLGMCNAGEGGVYFIERTPQRHTQQGLTQQMLTGEILGLTTKPTRSLPSFLGKYMRKTIMGDYPSFEDVLDNLRNPNVKNDVAAFDRVFALARGPVGTFFFIYRSDIVGFLPNGDISVIKISEEFAHLREIILEANLFKNVVVN